MDQSSPKKDSFMDRMLEVVKFGMETKRRMVARGSTRGRRRCPRCGGTVHAVLAGPRNHIHMACETENCDVRMME